MSEFMDKLRMMPLRYQSQIEAEVIRVWEMKCMAEESNKSLRAELKTWQDGCACTDKSKADVLALRARLERLEYLVATSVDPMDCTDEDADLCRECHRTAFPENYR